MFPIDFRDQPSDAELMSDADNRFDIDETAGDVGLWPPVFNVAPKAVLHATATCGQHAREEYCHTIDAHPQRHRKAKCGVCDAHDPDRMHPIDFVIDGSQRWWQSPTLNRGPEHEHITITMDLKQVWQIGIHSLSKAHHKARPTIQIAAKMKMQTKKRAKLCAKAENVAKK